MTYSLIAPIPQLDEVQTSRPVVTLGVDEPLVDLERFCGDAVLCSPQYVGTYPESPNRCYARASVARRIVEAQRRLPRGLRLLIYDAWRPLAVQARLFEAYVSRLVSANEGWSLEQARAEASRFVADPEAVVPPHSTGGAVDLTLASEDGSALWCGTDFDDFSAQSATRFLEEQLLARHGLPAAEAAANMNRRILYHAMVSAGFVNYPAEWWHFDYGDGLWAQVVGKPALYGATEAPPGDD